jgi:hypothetical protein
MKLNTAHATLTCHGILDAMAKPFREHAVLSAGHWALLVDPVGHPVGPAAPSEPVLPKTV